MNDMSVEKCGNEILAGKNCRNPDKNLPRLQFRPSQNLHVVTETPTRDPTVGDERLTVCTTEPSPPSFIPAVNNINFEVKRLKILAVY